MEALVRSHRKPQNSTLNGTYRICFPGASEDEHCQHYRSCVTKSNDSPLRVDRPTNDPRPIFEQTRQATHPSHHPSHETTLPAREKCTIGNNVVI